jgi:hypothetical protein
MTGASVLMVRNIPENHLPVATRLISHKHSSNNETVTSCEHLEISITHLGIKYKHSPLYISLEMEKIESAPT